MPEYIEREALLKYICETVLFTVRKNAKLPTAEMRGASKVIDRIKSMRTADVQEVKHGKWEVKIDHGIEAEIKCSECGFLYIEADPDEEYRHNYCPNCGAKMEDN